MKKKAIKFNRLSSNERPLFTPMNKVHKTKKDKANTRQNQKLNLKRILHNINNED